MEPSQKPEARNPPHGKPRDFQTIGSQLPSIMPSRPASESLSNSRNHNSETTPACTEESSSIGTQLSVIGSAKPPSSPAEAQTALANLTPLEIDQSLRAWLPPSLRCRVVPLGGADDHGWQTTGYEFKPGWDEGEGREGLRLLEMLNARAEAPACQAELARLSLLTKAKNERQEDLTIRIGVMAEELTQYPIDCVRDACRSWAKSEKWFPAMSELIDACDDRVMKRRALLLALKRYFEGTP